MSEKPWCSIDQQIQRFRDRGLTLDSHEANDLRAFLLNQNYYRLTGYSRLFLDNFTQAERFREGVSLGQIIEVYEADALIRRIAFEGVEIVELALRQRIAHILGQSLNPQNAYLNPVSYLPIEDASPEHGQDIDKWQVIRERQRNNRNDVLVSINEVLASRRTLPLDHYRDAGNPVPIWVIIEELTLGDLSKLVSTWVNHRQISLVAKSFKFESRKQLEMAVGNISFLRNIVAHHGRLWNRCLNRSVALPEWVIREKRRYTDPKSPAALLLLLAAWVDQIEGKKEYSAYLLKKLYESSEYANGIHNPRL